MVLVKSIAHAQELLGKYIPTAKSRRYTLERMQSLMDILDNPQDKVKIIHVAGTSGKTSTAYFAAALLVESGFKVGLSVSPHIDSITERAQINLQNVPEEIYCKELGAFLDIVQSNSLSPSYFEILVAFSFWLFHKQKVDYAVIEVGLGGLLDGTNVIHRPDKICVITDIGYDHTEILGTTLEEISAQKAGIIHEGNRVFMHAQAPEILEVVTTTAKQKHAPLTIINSVETTLFPDAFNELPSFQQRNFSLAYTAVKDIITPALDITAVLSVYIPARMEEIDWQEKKIILDGSHNEQKITALVEAVQKKYGSASITLLVSFGENKALQLDESLEALRAISSHVVITRFQLGQDEVRKAIDPLIVLGVAKKLKFNTTFRDDPEVAFEYALQQKQTIILVTGSFYLLNHIRPLMQLEERKRLGL